MYVARLQRAFQNLFKKGNLHLNSRLRFHKVTTTNKMRNWANNSILIKPVKKNNSGFLYYI